VNEWQRPDGARGVKRQQFGPSVCRAAPTQRRACPLQLNTVSRFSSSMIAYPGPVCPWRVHAIVVVCARSRATGAFSAANALARRAVLKIFLDGLELIGGFPARHAQAAGRPSGHQQERNRARRSSRRRFARVLPRSQVKQGWPVISERLSNPISASTVGARSVELAGSFQAGSRRPGRSPAQQARGRWWVGLWTHHG